MPRHSRTLALTVLLDVILVNLSFALAYYVRYELQLVRPVLDAFRAPYTEYLWFQLWYTVLMLIFLNLDGAYLQRRGGSWLTEAYRIASATTTVAVILIAATFIIQPLVYSRLLLAEAAAITIALLSGARAVRRIVEAQLRKRGVGVARVIIVGAGETGRAVMRAIVARPELGYQVVGFVDDDPGKGDLGRFKALGGLDQLGTLVKSERVDEVIIALPSTYHRKIIEVVRACEKFGARARVVPDLFHLSISRVDVDDIGGVPLLGLKEATIPRTGRLVKRALDILLSALALVLAAPLMLLTAIAVRLESPGPAIFKQIRIGQRGRPFYFYKFRSMRQGAEEEQARLLDRNEASGPLFKIKDDPRLTRVGRFLRRASIDELPQFFNVLKGEMSLVGPRPGLPDEVAQYQSWHRQRLEISPGISGLWQISGRSDLTFDEMVMLDIYYIENWSLGLDLTILLRTIPRVILGDGAY
jgi:exopolysaccharide biosynthesis polyprenyl glycosylphosphotransferase